MRAGGVFCFFNFRGKDDLADVADVAEVLEVLEVLEELEVAADNDSSGIGERVRLGMMENVFKVFVWLFFIFHFSLVEKMCLPHH